MIYVAESDDFFYEASGLEPYMEYVFTLTLCNKVGCVTSDPEFGKTLAAGESFIYYYTIKKRATMWYRLYYNIEPLKNIRLTGKQ